MNFDLNNKTFLQEKFKQEIQIQKLYEQKLFLFQTKSQALL